MYKIENNNGKFLKINYFFCFTGDRTVNILDGSIPGNIFFRNTTHGMQASTQTLNKFFLTSSTSIFGKTAPGPGILVKPDTVEILSCF